MRCLHDAGSGERGATCRAGPADEQPLLLFRVFRAMTRDAMHELGLERDPTLRVSFPAAEEKMDPNCLEPDELAAFSQRCGRSSGSRHRPGPAW
jgi:hypothetical protein